MQNIFIIKYFIYSLLSFTGFIIAFYIFSQKRKKKKLICPRKGNCDEVVNSEHSKFLGINLEVAGLFYYGFVFIFSNAILNIFFLTIKVNLNLYTFASYLLFVISTFAFVFSLYLIKVQYINLKKWCVWCLSSSFVSFLLFATSIYFYLR